MFEYGRRRFCCCCRCRTHACTHVRLSIRPSLPTQLSRCRRASFAQAGRRRRATALYLPSSSSSSSQSLAALARPCTRECDEARGSLPLLSSPPLVASPATDSLGARPVRGGDGVNSGTPTSARATRDYAPLRTVAADGCATRGVADISSLFYDFIHPSVRSSPTSPLLRGHPR